MELRNLITFLKVEEMHSFSGAANQLGYSQSTVTTQIKNLEEELGVKLFDRIGKKISLTNQGELYRNYARQIINLVQEASNELHEEVIVTGKLSIGLAESICTSIFIDIFQQFHELYPNVECVVKTAGSSEMFQMLRHNEVDLVFTFDQKIYQSDLKILMMEPADIYFFTATTHPLQNRKNLTIKDLLSEKFILTETGMSYRDCLDQYLNSQNLTLQPFLEIGNTEIIRSMVTSNQGISFLPEYVLHSRFHSTHIQPLNIKDFPISLWKQLICHKDKWITRPMEAMIELIMKHSK